MTTPAQPAPDGPPPEWLAAYADAELTAPARDEVERWLRDHPEARAELDGQLALSPSNVSFWDRAEPPGPSAAAWAEVRRGIGEALDSPVAVPGRRWSAAALAFAGLGVASAAGLLAWLAFGPVAPHAEPGKPPEVVKAPPELAPAPRPAPVAVALAPIPRAVSIEPVAVLPMATDDDVILDRVPALPGAWLPVGRHPLTGVLALAAVDEVDLEEVGPSPAWPGGMPKMTTGPGDAPMIFAARRR